MLFLRLYLLQGIRNYHSGNGEEAREHLNKVRTGTGVVTVFFYIVFYPRSSVSRKLNSA